MTIDPQALTALIERVENCAGPDRILDKEVDSALYPFSSHEPTDWARRYTTSIDAVVSLIEQKLHGHRWTVDGPIHDPGETFYAACINIGSSDLAVSNAHSPSRALLAACLRALQAKLPEHADANSKSPIQAREE